tara:strand:+ start:674 stop:823 length:150 start_codon:yes stop_codon:yes gene_type:complete
MACATLIKLHIRAARRGYEISIFFNTREAARLLFSVFLFAPVGFGFQVF